MLSQRSLLPGYSSSSKGQAGHNHRQCSLVHRSSSNPTSLQGSQVGRSPASTASPNSMICSQQQQAPSCRRFHTLIAAAAAATGNPSNDSSTTPASPPTTAAAEAEGLSNAAAAAGEAVDVPAYLLSDEPGPAFKATLVMLEWQRLCEHLARHSSTTLGRRLCLRLSVPLQEATSIRLQREVSAVYALENMFTNLLDFGGINSGDAEGAIKRAGKGGMVAAKQLRGLVTLLEGADRLKRQIALVARQNRATGPDSPLKPLLERTGSVSVPRALMGAILAAIQEDGELSDNASEQVRTTRARVRGLTARITNMIKGYPGEPSEKGGRICVAAPAGTKISNGVLLGTSVGGGMVYIEPGTVVSLNNELMSARAEAMSAEESVLWDLSARLMGVLDDVEHAFNTVGWLDLTAAKVRFGLWLGGVMPTFTPWAQVFDRRPPGAPFGAPLPPSSGPQPPAVSLQSLSHPLLLADYKAKKQRLEHQAQLSSVAAGAGSQKKGAGRVLGTRKDVMARRLSNSEASALLASMESGQQQEDSGGLTPEQQLELLQPPRPIDVTVQPQTAVVVITGPNTGGKTATMKALGLAACMAKTGMMLPAAAPARLPCFSSVLADIGDEQSLTASLSTFSGHIKRISAVRDEADGWSLLLLDELGTGTDPTEGAALGQALLKTLVRGGPSNGALTIATTHHSIMTGLKFDDGRVENASVEFDEEKLAPTYKLLWGIPGRSNALNIASRLGLDFRIIEAARERLAVGVAAANAAIEALESVQQEVREADMVLFAITANAQETKERVLQARKLNATKQQELLFKRLAALQEVLQAARPLVRALKEERKARTKKGSTTSTKVSRLLDAALGESIRKQPAKSLESALQAFDDLTGTSSSSSSSSSTPAASHAQALAQQQLAAEPWVATWTQLLSRARATLASSLLLGGDVGGSGSGGGVGSGGSDAEDAAAEMEEELQAMRQKEEAEAAAKDADVQAAQQILDEYFQVVQKRQKDVAAAADSTAPAAGEGSIEDADGQEEGSGQQQRQKRRKATFEEEVDKLAVVQGISLIEDALDEDAELWDSMQQQQAALAQQQAAEAQRKQQEAAAAAAELSQLEQQFVNEFEEFELEWYTAAAAAAEAAEAEQQRQQQQAAAAAAAAQQQQEQKRQQQEQRRRQQQEADLQLLRAFEEGDLEDLEGLESLLLHSNSSSSSSSSIPAPIGSQTAAAGPAAERPSSPNGSSSSKAASKQAAQPPTQTAAAAAVFDPDALFEELLNEFPEPWMNGQQQQQQPGGRKGKKKQTKPVFKFKNFSK